ncbi:MAG TPA: DNA helicase PriA [Acetivibrio sp.]|nr:DNA helicase PriA [Clostridium sp.]HOQ37668.1 DNA helicase PriA [Acetivibrio sp.]HPT91139.1 DNA helicase PriA [Acetivibrio sp.]HQA58304.1 DNA helicase PriA [Acetivibrio sp.]
MSSVKEYKCPSCGASLQFDPPSQSWKCHYCLAEYSKDEFDKHSHEEHLNEDMPDLDSYICNSCGAELIADDTTSATFCIYCKSAAIIKSRFSGRFKPKSVIPFKLTKEQAKQIYSNWIHKRILAPKEFKQKEEIDKVTGIYAPFWLFSCETDGFIQGEAKTIHTWRSGSYRYTQTKYYHFLRRGKARYKNIPVDASKKLDDKFMHMIEPYNYNEIQNFSMKYMSGFMAERYDVEANEAETIMKSRVEDYMEKRLRSTVIGYNSYSVNSKQVLLSDITASYSMLPIYLLINKYRGKDHIFIINGQTGKVVGDTPISPLRQIVFGLIVFAVVWIIAVFGGALFV